MRTYLGLKLPLRVHSAGCIVKLCTEQLQAAREAEQRLVAGPPRLHTLVERTQCGLGTCRQQRGPVTPHTRETSLSTSNLVLLCEVML